MIILHVGFGKTATTSLQKVVFPALCKHAELKYFSCGSYAVQMQHANLELGKEVFPYKYLDDSLVSCESLCSWDPFFWEEWARKNAIYFGDKAHVLLILREPESYFRSVYIQRCFHEGNVMPPEHFFLKKDFYSPFLSSAKFSVEDFSYKKIIDIYKHSFKRLSVIKYEGLSDLNGVKEVFEKNGISYDGWDDLSREFSRYRSNPSYGKMAVNLTFWMHRVLSFFGFSMQPGEVVLSKKILEFIAINDHRKVRNKTGLYRVKEKLSGRVWRQLMTKLVSRFSRKRYSFCLDEIQGLDMLSLKREYEKIDAIEHYEKGERVYGM